MAQRFDRKAIGARASAIYRAAKAAGETMTWPAAQKQAWAEAKSPRAVERCGTRVVVHIDGAQPGGVIAAMARYGIRVRPAAECVALIGNRVVEIGQHLTEIVQTAALRRQRNVDALKSGGRVVDLRQGNDGAYRI